MTIVLNGVSVSVQYRAKEVILNRIDWISGRPVFLPFPLFLS